MRARDNEPSRLFTCGLGLICSHAPSWTYCRVALGVNSSGCAPRCSTTTVVILFPLHPRPGYFGELSAACMSISVHWSYRVTAAVIAPVPDSLQFLVICFHISS
jgi:hypothetical protein